MLKAGYASVNIDDCWPLRQRDAAGNIVPDPAKFRTSTFDVHQQTTAAGVFLGVLLDRLRAYVVTAQGMGGFSKSLKALGAHFIFFFFVSSTSL